MKLRLFTPVSSNLFVSTAPTVKATPFRLVILSDFQITTLSPLTKPWPEAVTTAVEAREMSEIVLTLPVSHVAAVTGRDAERSGPRTVSA